MTNTKTGRNDPCPCGSGQKYKRCCLDKDAAAERAARAAADAAAAKPPKPARPAGLDLLRDDLDAESDELTTASNAIVDKVHAGKLDEAEQAAREFLVRFPEVHDGHDRLGMIYEARGDRQQAAHHYRQVVEFIRTHPEQYEPAFETTFLRRIEALDPPSAD